MDFRAINSGRADNKKYELLRMRSSATAAQSFGGLSNLGFRM